MASNQMLKIGKYNKLEVLEANDKGLILDGKDKGDLFLFYREAPENCKVGDVIEVFIYLNSNNSIVATTTKPLATVGQFAYLKVVSTGTIGAFVDWGLDKDLLVPYKEQLQPMREDKSYIVYVYFDEKSGRIAASTKTNKFINSKDMDYKEGQEVSLLIASQTDMGYKAIVNRKHWGILYKNEIFKHVQKGQQLTGFIKKQRTDGKLDLSLHKPGHTRADILAERIIKVLEMQNGFIALNDKSSPEAISKVFGESKSTFKNAIGILYKKRSITIAKDGIHLSAKEDKLKEDKLKKETN